MVSKDLLTEPVIWDQITNGKICGRKCPYQESAVKPAKLGIIFPFLSVLGGSAYKRHNRSTLTGTFIISFQPEFQDPG
jgi:hypothetical protein